MITAVKSGVSGRRWPWRGEDYTQGQMNGEKGDEPQRAQPQGDIEILVDPGLRLLVVDTVNAIESDREIWIGQMSTNPVARTVAQA